MSYCLAEIQGHNITPELRDLADQWTLIPPYGGAALFFLTFVETR